MSVDLRFSDTVESKRDIPSFIEPRPPLIMNPFMRPRPQKGTNLLQLFDEDCESDDSDWVKVYLRLKPSEGTNNSYEVRSDRHLVTTLDTATAGHGRRTLHNVSKMYTFSRIFSPGATQKEIFDQIVKDNLKKLPEGHNFTLLTYGASGSGKTYTLMGTVSAPGLVPRSLEYVFKIVDAAQQPVYKPADNGVEKLSYQQQELELQIVKRMRNVSTSFRERYRRASTQVMNDLTASTLDLSNRTQYYVWVSFVEIYNEKIYDLLSNSDRSKSSSRLYIREDSNGHVFVKGATQAFVRTGEEAYDVMVAGKYNLQVAATGVHAQSSRSHCIFTITMLTGTDGGVVMSQVRLCDLAGCERARHTRNTGARMQESRAINSSLHVLERCLRMLQRKQRHRGDTLVPYRESKLTRLLGAGLSGARNEAVTMVVALNPAPQYAQENKHVLQLAAVAGDIQVNSTIAESTLESSTQDSTALTDDTRYEFMKLREENDRLHFELANAQSCISKLQAAMDDQQTKSADTMYEVMKEAKDMTRQYYEPLLESLRAEMEEMREEYEAQLKAATAGYTSVVRLSTDHGTPSRSLIQKNKRLETELASKEEELNVERLARARCEEEIQHLLTCISERDEKENDEPSTKEETEEESIEESESDEDDDPANQSLELTVKKRDINRSRLHRRSTIDDIGVKSHSLIEDSLVQNNTCVVELESDDEQLEVTFKKISNADSNDESFESNTNIDADDTEEQQDDNNDSVKNTTLTDNSVNGNQDIPKPQNSGVRGTYFISNDEGNTQALPQGNTDEDNNTRDSPLKEKGLNSTDIISVPLIDQQSISLRGAYFFKDEKPDNKYNEPESKPKHRITPTPNANCDSATKNDLNTNEAENKLTRKTTKSVNENDTSLAQFEQLEKALTKCEINKKDVVVQEKPESCKDDKIVNVKSYTKIVDDRNKKDLVVQEKPQSCKDDKKAKVKNHTKSDDECNMSLAQFEQLEKDYKDNNKVENTDLLSDIKFSKDKNYFFDEKREPYVKAEYLTEAMKRINFLGSDRSPSIVKDEVSKDFKPEQIKRILGENLTRPEVTPDVTKNPVGLPKKHVSVDIFESPIVTSPIVKIGRVISENSDLKQIDKVFQACEQDPDKNDDKCDINGPAEMTEAEKPEVEQTRANKRNELLNEDDINDIPINTAEVVIKCERIDISEYINVKTNDKQSLDPVFKVPSNAAPLVSKKELSQIDVNSSCTTNNTIDEFENIYKDVSAPNATAFDQLLPEETANNKSLEKDSDKTKYNLRHKSNNSSFDRKEKTEDEVLLESQAKCEIQKTQKRSLRLRKRKIQPEDDKNDNGIDKLKDIVNLQKEFSDVTLDVPVTVTEKHVPDIPSPEKTGEEENLPPNGIQSCPSKSVQRSRRKLFTPRAEVLEESLGGGDSNERIYVPRPSYHRGRARRKL